MFCLAAFLMCNYCGPDVRSETSVSDPSDNIGSAGQELSSGQSSSSDPVQSSEVSSDLNSELPVAAVRNTPLQKDEAVMNVRISELPGEDPFHVALGAAPDPFVTFCAETDYYYGLSTQNSFIKIHRSKILAGLFETGESCVVYRVSLSEVYDSMWAPEMWFMDGHWYIYSSGQINITSETKHLFVLESKSADPFDGFELKAFLDNNIFGIDPTVYIDDENNKRYISFSQVINGYQYISIAELITPWQMGEPVTISDPQDFEWEYTTDGPLNEGPFFVKNGKRLFLIYSANGCYSDSYCLGILEYNGCGMLSKTSWNKYPEPIFVKNEAGGIYAPGHASFFYSPDHTELWIAYQCYYTPNIDRTRRMRICQVQRVSFDETGFPVLGKPLPEGTQIAVPSGE